MKKLILIIGIIVFSITSFSQTGKWKKVFGKNSIESYQEFRNENPHSDFSDEATLKLIELVLTTLCIKNCRKSQLM